MNRWPHAFLDRLMTTETGIDLDLASWYAEHLDEAMTTSWRIETSGRLWRDFETGLPAREQVSLREHFRRYGLGDIEHDLRAGELRRSRYRVTNAWGFVGYQLGEAVLMEAGYYDPPRVRCVVPGVGVAHLPSYYSGDVAVATWRHGVREARHRPYGRGEEILATDINKWNGRFTGKHGVSSLEALMTPEVQEGVFRNLLEGNLTRIRVRVSGAGLTFDEAIERRSKGLGKRVDTSGCLAGAHLCGADGVADFLLDGSEALDETGTRLSHYLDLFSGYDVTGIGSGLAT